ncbi:MAG: ATP-binding protein, partial [Candidatus Saccharibacteria bacterium]|nr:ATP-binding protein [Candidatus Saccharibacteria bacterium]
MTPEEAVKAVKKLRQYGAETNQLEAKTAKGGFSKKWHDTLSSFSNKYGGIIIFGLSEDEGFKSETINDLKSLQRKIVEFC